MLERFRGPKIYLERGVPKIQGEPVFRNGIPHTNHLTFPDAYLSSLQIYIRKVLKELKKHPEKVGQAKVDFVRNGLNPNMLPRKSVR